MCIATGGGVYGKVLCVVAGIVHVFVYPTNPSVFGGSLVSISGESFSGGDFFDRLRSGSMVGCRGFPGDPFVRVDVLRWSMFTRVYF